MQTQSNEPNGLLALFRAARKPECPLCGSREWGSPRLVAVDRKDMGGVYEHICARSPCSHVMRFTAQTLRESSGRDRKLLRNCA
jgi:hypothetical protein